MDIAYLQILLLLLQCTIIAVLLLFLFRLRTVFGLSLLLITLGVFQFIQVFLTSTLSIEIYSGYQVSPGSMVLFTGSLFAVLLVYLREDTLKARKIIYALFIANVIIGLLLVIFSFLINGVFVNNVYNLPVEFYSQNTKIIFVGTLLLLLDGYAIVFLYEFLSKYIKWLFLKMLLTMVIVLSMDTLFFAVGVFAGAETFQSILISGIVSKSVGAFIYSAIFSVYLIFIEKKSLEIDDGHASFTDIFRDLTFRAKYEDVLEKMRIKTEELQETQDIAQLGSYVLDFKTNTFESSPVFDSICGLTDKKLKTHEYYRNIIHPDDLELNNRYYLESIRTKKPYNRKYRLYRSDNNELRWVNEQGRAIYNKGEPVKFKGTLRDITDQKFNEFALKKQNEELNNLSKELSVKNELLLESERKFKNLFDKSPISLWEEDFSIVKKLVDKKKTKTDNFEQYLNDNPDFVAECLANIKILNVNEVTLELLGVSNKEDLITHLSNNFNVKSYETLKKELNALAEGEKEFTSETQFTRSDGKIITTLIKFVVITDDFSRSIISIVDITELSLAKDKIEESEKKFKSLFDKNPVSLWDEDFSKVKRLLIKKQAKTNDLKNYLDDNPDFVLECISKLEILNVNDISLELLGYNNKEELLTNFDKIFSVNSIEVFKEQLIAIAESKKEFVAETEMIRKNGKVIIVLIKFVPISDRRAIVSLVDISELNKAKEKIVKSEKQFRELYEKSGDAIFIIENGIFVQSNKAATDLFGYKSNEEILNRDPSEISPKYQPDGKTSTEKSIEMMQAALKKGTHRFEWIHINVKGQEFPVEVLLTSILNEPHKKIIHAVVRDITEWKKTQTLLIDSKEKIEESEKQFRELFEKSGDAILIIENEIFTECNEATIEMLEYNTKAEFLNVHPSKLSPPKQPDGRDSFEKAVDMMETAMDNGTHRFEWIHTKKSGENFPVEVLLTAISDEPNNRIIHCVWRDITERKRAAEALQNSQERMKLIFEEAPDGIYLMDLKGHLLDANKAAEEILGYKKEKVIGKSLFSSEFITEDQLTKAIELLQISRQLKGTVPNEIKLKHKDGRVIVVEVRTFPVNIEGKTVLLGIARDITFRKEAEQSIQESETALRKAQEIAQLGFYDLDLKTLTFKSSSVFDSLVGFRAADVKTLETWRSVVHPEDLEGNKVMLENCIKTKTKFNREYRIIHKNNKAVKWLHALGEISYEKDIPKNFRGTIQDITERKLNELAILLNEKKLIEIQKIANLGTYEIDLKTNIVSASSIYKSILGIKETPKNNKGWWKSITHPDDYKNSELLWQECITNCKIYEDEYRIINDKNEIKWIYDLAEVKCENGIPSKVVGTIQDITSRKFSEERIRRSNAIINQITSLIQVVDKKGNITYASPSFKTVLGFEPEEILGLGWWIKTTPDLDTAYKLRDDILNNVRNNAPLTDEIKNRWITTKDGKPKLFDWISSKGEEDSLIFIGIDVTEKIIADLNIVQYWKIVEDSLNEIYIFDAETFKFIEVNRGARENIGYSIMELEKMTPIDLKPMYTKHLFNELIDPLKSGAKNRIVFNTIHKRKNGTQYTAEIHLQKSQINQKEVYIAFVKDITLQEHEENIKQVLFNITKRSSDNIRLKDFFYFIKNELGKLINTNNFFIALYDDKTDMISTPYMIDEFDEGTDFPKGETLTGHVIDTKKALLTSEKFVSYTAEGKKVIGLGPESKCWLGVPLLIDDIAIGAIVVQSYTDENAYSKNDVAILELVASNIAQLIQKTEDLERIQLLNQGLIQSSHGVIITNLEGEIEYTNPAFTELTGYTEKEALGKNPRMLKSGEHLEAFYTNLYDTILKGNTWYGELTNKHKDGHKYLIDANISSVKNLEGKITHYIMIFEDITTKRELERQFINAFIDAQEVEKQNFGEELHDGISQILSAESMYIDLLIEQNQDRINDKAKFLTKIKELNLSAVNETRNIAHGLMSSQLKQSGLLIAAENICIDFNVVKNIKFSFFKKGLNEEDISKEIKINLFRIIQELTTNINRYSSATKASIEFRKLDHNKLKLTVKDNGIGMDYKKIKKERKVTGLQNVERRITFLKGTYEVESAPNNGTCWEITVPL